MSCVFCGVELRGNVFLAPMAGITNRPFRTVALELGCGLAFTEMISAAGLVKGDRKTRAYLPGAEEAGRVAIQLFGCRPDLMREAVAMLNDGPAPFLDVNLGCPARKIVRAGCGAALLREPAKVAAILEAACGAARKPVLAKIRSGWDDASLNAVEIARIAKGCGVAALTVHGRTARQGFGGRADWEFIRRVALEGGLPVVGNGDLADAPQIERALRDYGCAAVMVGRGALGNPWIFAQAAARGRDEIAPPPDAQEVGRVMRRHLELSLEQFGPRRGVHLMRRHLVWYSRGRSGAAEFRRRVVTLERPEEVRDEIARFLGEHAQGRA